jgi:hypothetical protein
VHGTAKGFNEERSKRGSSKPRPSRSPTPSDHESHDSGSTYYVLPTPGQKVHVIVSRPNYPLGRFGFNAWLRIFKAPDKSIYTATSTTKSPTSPSLRKPFFHRLFDIFSSTESSKGSSRSAGSKRLQRRHSTGGRHRGNERRVH